MNVDGMLPFENMVADYVKETDNHVLYRVTPIYDGNNLLANGVQMEAYSIEDDGDGICFNVFVYNAQPQISINYANGDSSYVGGSSNDVEDEPNSNIDTSASYILNKNKVLCKDRYKIGLYVKMQYLSSTPLHSKKLNGKQSGNGLLNHIIGISPQPGTPPAP